MERKIQILLIFFICLSLKIYSQKCGSIYETGDHLINEIKFGTICFKRDTEKKPENIYYTKYTFKLNNDFYYLEFTFFINESRITVVYTNQFNTPRSKEIKFDPKGSLILFKDYKANEKNIRKNEYYTILFGIPDEFTPYVTLYHFQLMDDENISFKTRDITDDKLNNHNKLASIYEPFSPPPPPPPPPPPDKLKREINDYKDSIKKEIEIEDQSLLEKLWPRKAETEVLNKITNQLNSEFNKYLKNIFPYQDINCQIGFNFKYNADGKNLTLKSMYFFNSLPVKWLEDSIRNFILPKLYQLFFDPMTLTLKNRDLVNNFKKRFSGQISSLNLNVKNDYDLNENYKMIIENLETLSKRIKPINTEFTYILDYQSKVKFEVWKYEPKTRKSEEILIIEDSNEQVTPELRALFFSNIILEKKKSKYMVKRSQVTINKEKTVEDLKPNY